MPLRALITGTSSNQYSQKTVDRTMSFAWTLSRMLKCAGYVVDVSPPNIAWTKKHFDAYDAVFVGISPPLSVTSNGAYGALAAIGDLANSEKLTLFSDCPEPWKLFANLKAVQKDPARLFKDFYRKRSGYSEVVASKKNTSRVMRGVSAMSGDKFPRTVYPELPWSVDADIPGVPASAQPSFSPLMPDVFIVDECKHYFTADKEKKWLVDGSSRWTKNSVGSLQFPHTRIESIKPRMFETVMTEIQTSFGVLIGSHDDGATWWSPRYAQSVCAGTHVVTDWRSSMNLGPSWSNLPARLESMTTAEYVESVHEQRQSYMRALSTPMETTQELLRIARIK